ncbi:cation:dicarboxylate symporter family transporter [Lysinibacillus sp. ZYM-1]|uniref:cation:dicarboxylate symporter family transporter n=1 Tax=Lysinibacillus sp. ZYM-1 TaxID=1681184 RepID=UPI001E4D139C|nr:cation:dicarboxylase symporter family transporter [Lysinibacillus sp. ZYM-1]
MLVAASTTSSSATLPASMEVARDVLKVPESIYGFTLPLGITLNNEWFSINSRCIICICR